MDELNDAAMKTTDEQFDCDKQATQAVRNNPHDCGKFTTVPCSYGDDIAKKSRTDLTKCESTNVEQSAGGSNGSGDVPRNEDTHVCNDKNNDTSTPDAMNDEAQTSNADTEHVMALSDPNERRANEAANQDLVDQMEHHCQVMRKDDLDVCDGVGMDKDETSMAFSPKCFVARTNKMNPKRHSDESNLYSKDLNFAFLKNVDCAPTDAKKAKTGAIVFDSDEDEFYDAHSIGTSELQSQKEVFDKKQGETSSSSSSSSSSLSSKSDDEQEPIEKEELEADEDDEKWLKQDVKDLPLPRWSSVKQMRHRQCNDWNRYWPYAVCGWRAMVERFELYQQLEKHEGCVNALHFNQTGTLLASGSDDLNIILWDWTTEPGHPVVEFDSGHRSNVFQAKFMPNCGDSTVVSSARDGQVRVSNISSTGTCHATKKIAQHRGSAHKLSLDVDSKSTFLSCGEDGVVFGIDLRLDKPAEKIAVVKVDNRKIPLYSIHTNPALPYEFAVSGRDYRAHVFDRRMLGEDVDRPAVKRYCPHRLRDASDIKANITCLVYSWDGSELLCSYNDEDIYLFNTKHSDGADYIKRYKGHRNNATVKGVNFYGPHSDFIVSGSDCGNVFFWEKESAQIVQLVDGDKGGVVNVLEPHPHLPVIATSGLDHDVKIWTPSSDMHEKNNHMSKLTELMLSNRREREEERSSPDMIDGHMLWFLMRTLRNRRLRAVERRDRGDDTSSNSDENDSSSMSSGDSDADGAERNCIQS